MTKTKTLKDGPSSARKSKIKGTDVQPVLRLVPRDGRSIAELLIERLRLEMATGELPPGRRVREIDLADRFGVSRTPVREALKRLEADGLLVEVPGRGLTVAKPSLSEILDDYLIREVLEGLAARLAAERALEVEIITLKSHIKNLKEAHDAGDMDKAINYIQIFDKALFEAARNPRLHRTIEVVRAAQGRIRRGPIEDTKRRSEAIKELDALLAAVVARDPAAAELAAQQHLQNARNSRIEWTLKFGQDEDDS